VFVTGATGFVGTHLVRRLADFGYAVSAGIRDPRRAASLLPPGTTALPFDLDQVDAGDAKLEKCSCVIHLAAQVHLKHPTQQQVEAYSERNAAATAALARAAAERGVRRFILLSSIKVNGEQTTNRAFRDDDTPAPTDVYGRSKLEAERAVNEIAARTGMDFVVIRPPLVYGPGVKANFLALLRCVNYGIPLPLAGLSNRRSLVGVSNLVDLILQCVEHPAAANEIFLVADGQDLSTSDLLLRIGKALGKPARLFPISTQVLEQMARLLGKVDDVRRLCGSLQVDASRTFRALDWSPAVSIDEELLNTARHFLNTR
jgi:UDP-glucose 4-epimerase